jgi:hypothetical protein
VGQFFLAQFAEPDLGPRFPQAELSRRQDHFGTNLVLGLFEQVETRQDPVPVPVERIRLDRR